MGGSGDYFSVADNVIQMNDYQPADVSQTAHEIAASLGDGRIPEGSDQFGQIRHRTPLLKSFNPYHSRHRIKIAAPRRHEILFGKTDIDLGDLEQIVEKSQTRGLSHALYRAMRYVDNTRTLKEVTDRVLMEVEKHGLDILTPYLIGDIAEFRRIELAGAVNRMRTLQVRQTQ
jgi:predicted ABC-class ATPase